MSRNKTDEELQAIIDRMDENERAGLKVGMIPARLKDKNLSNQDVAELMRMNPEGHL